ncbi:MAG: methyltransferase type 11, partial [Phenylobacterium sp.]
MRALILPVCLAALAAACDSEPSIRISRDVEQAADAGGALRVVETLQCPQTHTVLTRRGAPTADGLSCEYTGPRGSQVTLRLVTLDGDGLAALDALETEVQGMLPAAIGRVGEAVSPEPAAAAVRADAGAGEAGG